MPNIEFNGKKLTVTMDNGDKAGRATKNDYRAVVVAYDAAGKLFICSCHYNTASAHETVATVLAGGHVNFNYPRRSTVPVIVC